MHNLFCGSLNPHTATYAELLVFCVLASWESVRLSMLHSHSRYADLKQVVLDELLAEHGDAQLDTQLHEAACMGTLEGEEVNKCQRATRSQTEAEEHGEREGVSRVDRGERKVQVRRTDHSHHM